ncbi:uncharacterized protein [Watersipora subatra]|uniref:uncharacterized protein n=1 Tax=Watersipora subatra TaxID=2589382 RepID=UPI00355B0127
MAVWSNGRDEVKLSVDSIGYPSVYKDESITLTCTTSGDTDATGVYLLNNASSTVDRTACRYNKSNNTWPHTNFKSLSGFNRIDRTYCEAAAAAAPPFIVSVPGTVSDELFSVNFKCLRDFTSRVSSTSFFISTINVKPGNLVMNSPDKIAEGKEFTFNCTSTGGSPDSVYDYEVLRGNIVVASTNIYTPTEDDREGLILRCKDITHLALANLYPDIIIKSEDKKPHYIDYEVIPTVLHQDPKSPLTLSCNAIGNPTPSYTWICSKGCKDTATYQLVIPANSREDGQLERIRCSVSIELFEPIINIYDIVWTDVAGLPSTTQALLVTEGDATFVNLFGSVAGVLAVSLVALVSQSAVFCWWKKRADKKWKRLESQRISQPAIADTEMNSKTVPYTDTRDDNYASLITANQRDHPYVSVMHEKLHAYENVSRSQPVLGIKA